MSRAALLHETRLRSAPARHPAAGDPGGLEPGARGSLAGGERGRACDARRGCKVRHARPQRQVRLLHVDARRRTGQAGHQQDRGDGDGAGIGGKSTESTPRICLGPFYNLYSWQYLMNVSPTFWHKSIIVCDEA